MSEVSSFALNAIYLNLKNTNIRSKVNRTVIMTKVRM